MRTALVLKICVPAVLMLAAALVVNFLHPRPHKLTPQEIAVQQSLHTAYIKPTTDIP